MGCSNVLWIELDDPGKDIDCVVMNGETYNIRDKMVDEIVLYCEPGYAPRLSIRYIARKKPAGPGDE